MEVYLFCHISVFLHPILLVVMKRIKSEYPLADIFNFVLGKLSVLKSISEPITFSSRDNAIPALFYDVVLYEKYFNDTMSKLTGWIDVINEYKSVGYDHSKFVEMKENEYRETWLFDSEDDIPYFSFKSCLVCEDYKDIVLDCSDDDITNIMNVVSLFSRFDICEFFKIPSYKIEEDGTIHERTFADNEMDKASNSVMIDDVRSTMIHVNRKIHSLVDYIKSIDEDKFDESVVTKIERGVFEILMDGGVS